MTEKTTVASTATTRGKESGFNLIEIAIVMAIIGLLVGGIWVAAASVSANQKEQAMQTQLLSLTQNIRQLYYGQASLPTGDFSSTLVSLKGVPGDMINGTKLVNPWGGSVTVVGAVSSTASTFAITYNDLPESSCTKIVARTSINADEIGLRSLSVGGSSMPLPATLAQASSACSGGAVSVVYTFARG